MPNLRVAKRAVFEHNALREQQIAFKLRQKQAHENSVELKIAKEKAEKLRL